MRRTMLMGTRVPSRESAESRTTSASLKSNGHLGETAVLTGAPAPSQRYQAAGSRNDAVWKRTVSPPGFASSW